MFGKLLCALGIHSWVYDTRAAKVGDFRSKPDAATGDIYFFERCRRCLAAKSEE